MIRIFGICIMTDSERRDIAGRAYIRGNEDGYGLFNWRDLAEHFIGIGFSRNKAYRLASQFSSFISKDKRAFITTRDGEHIWKKP